MMEIYTFSISNDACSGGQMVEMYSFSMGEDESARADAQNYLNKNGSKKSIFSKGRFFSKMDAMRPSSTSARRQQTHLNTRFEE